MATIASGDTASTAEVPGSISPWRRALLVFTRPAGAWDGLKEHAQWWFPLLVVSLVLVGSSLVLYERAIIPTQMEAMDRKVASGEMQSQQVDQAEQAMRHPVWKTVGIVAQVIFLVLATLFTAFVIWFGVGFVLGTGMRYRLALEVASWSLLVTIPASLLTSALAWSRESMRGVHVGFGLLLPDMDPPSKLHVSLGVLLDWIGPLSIWYLVVAILGAAALSGAPRKPIARTVGILYLVMGFFMAGLAALFTPNA